MKWETTVEEDDFGEQVLVFPSDMLAELGWKEGDTIEWTSQVDGSAILTKVDADPISGNPISTIKRAEG